MQTVDHASDAPAAERDQEPCADRRRLLGQSARLAGMLCALGLMPSRTQAQTAPYATAAFGAASVPEALKALRIGAPVLSRDITLNAPELAENGAEVQIAASTTLPGVKRLLLLLEKNPAPLAALFDLADAVEPFFSTNVKLAQSSKVYAVAILSDGRVLYAANDVKVTLGGCAD
jgi:sulfur-oxidizing protein SoxY